MLQIIINSSNNIDVGEDLKKDIASTIEGRLGRFAERLTRIEVHIGDEAGSKQGDSDTRCMIEARPEGMRPLNVTQHAGTVEEAVKSAAHKLERVLDDALQKLGDPKGRRPAGRPE